MHVVPIIGIGRGSSMVAEKSASDAPLHKEYPPKSVDGMSDSGGYEERSVF